MNLKFLHFKQNNISHFIYFFTFFFCQVFSLSVHRGGPRECGDDERVYIPKARGNTRDIVPMSLLSLYISFHCSTAITVPIMANGRVAGSVYETIAPRGEL